MNIKLIKENATQRFYQLDFKVYKYRFGSKTKTIKELFSKDPLKLKDRYELAEDLSDSIDKVCISDATTHIERLCFPAFNVVDKETGETILTNRLNHICGKWTMMIHGGNSDFVYKDETYIRSLRMINRGA